MLEAWQVLIYMLILNANTNGSAWEKRACHVRRRLLNKISICEHPVAIARSKTTNELARAATIVWRCEVSISLGFKEHLHTH